MAHGARLDPTTHVVGRLVDVTDEATRIERQDGSTAVVPLVDVMTWNPFRTDRGAPRPAASFSVEPAGRTRMPNDQWHVLDGIHVVCRIITRGSASGTSPRGPRP